MIIMTKAQANQVRGHHVDGHALAPRPFKNDNSVPAKFKGRLALPEDVLNDPHHDQFWDLLSKWPKVPDSDIDNGEWDEITNTWIVEPDWETDPVLTAPHDYSSDWPIGEIIIV